MKSLINDVPANMKTADPRVKVAPEDWVYLGNIAVAIHVSRSLIFIHCVQLLRRIF